MGRGFIKLNGMYLLWSTIVDAPISKPMYRDEAIETALRKGWRSQESAEESLRRADEKGISYRGYEDLDAFLALNRAGPNETSLTKDELVAVFWPATDQQGERR